MPLRQLLYTRRGADGRLLSVQLRGRLLLQLSGLDGLQRHERLLHLVLRRHRLRWWRCAVDALSRRHFLQWRRNVCGLFELPRRSAVRPLRRGVGVLSLDARSFLQAN